MDEEEDPTVTHFSLFSFSNRQREYLTIKIFPMFDTFYFKILFFIVATLLVFVIAISMAFLVIKCFEYIYKLMEVEYLIITIFIFINVCVFQASHQSMLSYRACVLPPSYSSVVRVENQGLPSYSQACMV